MIPRIQTGNNFRGAGLYYLHDKRLEGERERFTNQRVAWTHALNTMETEPEAVLAEMQQTVRDQSLLKELSGNRPDGRPTERTVMTVALAWSPDQSPDRDTMIAAGESYLKHMGWSDHQVLMVAHNDTRHPHVHLIINRIHPETGMTLDGNWSKTRSQQWALKYERENGRIYCEQREAKYGRDQVKEANYFNYREWQAWQEVSKDKAIDPEFRPTLQRGEWDVLKGGQRQDRTDYWKETGVMRQAVRAALREEVRDEFAEAWSAYALERTRQLEKIRIYDREARRAVRTYRKAAGTGLAPVRRVKDDKGTVRLSKRGQETSGIESIKKRRDEYHRRVKKELAQQRATIQEAQRLRFEALSGKALQELSTDRARDYRRILDQQRAERGELGQDQREDRRRYDLLEKLSPREGMMREATDRTRETNDKEREQEARRAAGIKWYIAKRQNDREQERGGRGD